MTCECCHCCFCCCEQNYDNNPNPTKKPKVETPVTRTTQIPKPPVVTDRSEPVIQWPDELIPGPPTVEEWMERPPIEIIRANNDAAEEEEQFSFPPKTPEEPPPPLVQYTPYTSPGTQPNGSPIVSIATRYTNATEVSQAVPGVIDQGPTPEWENPTNITDMTWDGVPISDPYGKTPAQLCAWMFKGRQMKGLVQHYNNIQPFANPANPTVAEIDNWNIEVIRHFRRLLGLTAPIQPRAELYLEAAWGEYRYQGIAPYNSILYPGTFGSAYGPCILRTTDGDPTNVSRTTNSHCGATFVLNPTDQATWLTQYPGLTPFTFIGGGAEGINTINTNLPWAMKLSGIIQNWVCSEGLVGHAGPFCTRTQVGMAFFASSDGRNATSRFRGKWLG